MDYAARYLTAVAGTPDEERATKRVAFLKATYGDPANGAASMGQAVPAPVATGAWSTAAQASSADLTSAQGSGLIDRGHALNATGIALTVTGGALVVGGVTWTMLARRGLK